MLISYKLFFVFVLFSLSLYFILKVGKHIHDDMGEGFSVIWNVIMIASSIVVGVTCAVY